MVVDLLLQGAGVSLNVQSYTGRITHHDARLRDFTDVLKGYYKGMKLRSTRLTQRSFSPTLFCYFDWQYGQSLVGR